MDNFFDFHIHPTVKKQLVNQTNPPSGTWSDITWNDIKKHLTNLEKVALKGFLKESFVSQSSLNQLSDANFRIFNVALFAPDRNLLIALGNNCLLGSAINKDHLKDVIDKERFAELQVLSTSRFQIILNDLELLNVSSGNSNQVIKLSSNTNLDEDNADNLYVVFSVEGVHCLRSNLSETNETAMIYDILTNLDVLRSKCSLLSINLAHIDNDNGIFSNQAFAMDGVGDLVDVDILYPNNDGFKALGKEITQQCYDRDILIDVKHMSIKSRLEFYTFRNGLQNKKPIICSHAGFTGCWYKHDTQIFSDFFMDITDLSNHKKVRIAKPTPYSFHANDITPAFNAASINLFNEDILEILRSDGIIGISLDKRILGYNDRNLTATQEPFTFDLDIFSNAEFATMKTVLGFDSTTIAQFDNRTAQSTSEFDSNKATTSISETHLRHFTIHVVHAMKLAKDHLGGIDAVRKLLRGQLCIGSDFDGLISAIDCGSNVLEMASLKRKFKRDLEDCINALDSTLKPSDMTYQEIADNIFYENGKNFVLNRLPQILQFT